MNSQTSVTESGLINKVKDFIIKEWDNFNEPTKKITKKIWGLISYKWQWQIILNTPFLIIWVLDKNVPQIHQLDMELLQSLPISEWIYSVIKLG